MDASLFGKLSAEIRNQIYDLVLTLSPGAVPLDPISRAHSNKCTHPFVFPLIHTCSQIRAEIKPMFYSRNKFCITISNRQWTHLKTWLDLVGAEDVRLVRRLDVTIRERKDLMGLAMEELIQVAGGKGVKFGVKKIDLGYQKQAGRREKGRGRYQKKGWKG